jgi:catechol 2,3-dioxygenase-like lactoylglutathione lyase family enzyme
MSSITGFGGAFVRANDPEALYRWYEQHLGLVRSHGAFAFPASAQRAQIVFAFFGKDDEYFPPAQKAMINLQVDDLDGVLDRLIAEGVTILEGSAGSPTQKEIVSSFGSPSQLVDAELVQMSPRLDAKMDICSPLGAT